MISFLTKKILYALAVMAGVVIFVFLIFLGFGDPARLVAGQNVNRATLENIRKDLHLDQPRYKRFLWYCNDLSPVSVYTYQEWKRKSPGGYFTGDSMKVGIKWPYLGVSYQTRKPVSSLIAEALPGTFILAVSALLFATLLGIALGVLAAVKKGTWLDTAAVFSSVLGISAPSFFVAILLAYVLGFLLHSYTGLPMYGYLFNAEPFQAHTLQWQNLILPALTLGLRPLAIITQLTRSSMLDVLQQDFIRTALAKGLSYRRVVVKHVLPNSINPVITAVTGWFAELLAGSFFVEYIFGWKGVGKLTVDALEMLDFPVIMGTVLLIALIFLCVNLLADLLYSYTDPRIS